MTCVHLYVILREHCHSCILRAFCHVALSKQMNKQNNVDIPGESVLSFRTGYQYHVMNRITGSFPIRMGCVNSGLVPKLRRQRASHSKGRLS